MPTDLCAGVVGRMGVMHVMSTEYNCGSLEYILFIFFRQWIVALLKAGTMKILLMNYAWGLGQI